MDDFARGRCNRNLSIKMQLTNENTYLAYYTIIYNQFSGWLAVLRTEGEILEAMKSLDRLHRPFMFVTECLSAMFFEIAQNTTFNNFSLACMLLERDGECVCIRCDFFLLV